VAASGVILPCLGKGLAVNLQGCMPLLLRAGGVASIPAIPDAREHPVSPLARMQSVYTDIEVRNLDIVKSSISLHTDIEAQTFDIGKYSIFLHTDIEVQNFNIEV
jgi:hypothetical protein